MTASTGVCDAVPAGFERLTPIGLAELDRRAALQTRVDRKYLVPAGTVQRLLGEFGCGLRVLDIGGRRCFDYRSVYFDTRGLSCYHQHLQGRRRRFKVRTRTYVQSGLCRLEVKGKGARGQTVKKNRRHDPHLAHVLDAAASAFVDERLGDAGVADTLCPALDTLYRRATLLDTVSGTRMTCDTGITWRRDGRHPATLDGAVLVETKSERGASPLDRWLWSQRLRPRSMSKYCLGVAMLYPGVRANPWHRTLRDYCGWQPPLPGRAAA